MSLPASHRPRVNHRRNPASLLVALIEKTRQTRGIDDPAAAREALRAGLRRKNPQDWAVKLATEFQVSPEYVSQHLIHLASWDIELQDAVRDGLPLPVARKIATLIKNSEQPNALLQAALEPFREASTLSNAKRARAVERTVMRLETNRGLKSDLKGWLPPSEQPQSFDPPERQAWIFEPLGRSGVEREALHPDIARRLIARYSARGSRVIDPFAGTGVIGLAAHELGRWSYSSDLAASGSAFIKTLSVEQLESEFDDVDMVADLAILHPPTVQSWCEQTDQSAGDYEVWLKYVINLISGIQVERGTMAVIVQPTIHKGLSAIATVISAFTESGITLKACHVAVSSSASEQWLIFVGERERLETDDEKKLVAQKKRLQKQTWKTK